MVGMKKLIKQKFPILSNRKLKVIRDDLSVAYGDNKDNLLRRALYKTSNQEVSKDLVQTTFLKTLLYLQKGGKVELMRSFLNHILADLIVDEYRKNKTLSLDSLLEKGFEPDYTDFEKNIDMLDGKSLALLIPQLPQKYEIVIRLRYLEGLSLKEIGVITSQSENTVAVQVHRGLAKLKELYVSDATA